MKYQISSNPLEEALISNDLDDEDAKVFDMILLLDVQVSIAQESDQMKPSHALNSEAKVKL